MMAGLGSGLVSACSVIVRAVCLSGYVKTQPYVVVYYLYFEKNGECDFQ